ncbi:MAG: sulfite exporter TauE/SafE family protein [Bauldia sp.]|uniref:sulfite exporter TauE/SafE family protein n=1 Tax=Bauldia sp. TaxID=2575872 RepID=UPI001E0FFDDF|nr:sulfite exporter TauE/SafE family protein [Bauldia sp.]MCB1490187.1 sulfite exporter TauE/SafE family protein [Bauldia sp.]MCB1494204.1 sulfite exporter TauE/SafE family protein [Bauldia sp.]
MQITATSAELIQLGIALLLAGALSGLLAGIFGIGGGAVIVPVLYQALVYLGVDESVRMHVAVGTSLAIIVPTSLRSFFAHKRRGAVDMALFRSFLIPVPLGVIVASIVAASISGAALRGIFAAIALAVALKLILQRQGWQLGQDIPGNPSRAIIGGLIGFFSTLMGIGGGIITNTYMTLFGRPIHQAVATSSGVGVLISIPGVIGYVWAGWGNPLLPPFSLGFVNLIGVLVVIPASVLIAPLGVRIAHVLTRRQLELGFGIFLVVVAIRFAVSLL